MSNKLTTQAEFCNLPEWWSNGFDGTGVTVWNTEGLTPHGKKSRRRVLDSAPKATVINGNISSKTKNGVFSDVKVNIDYGDHREMVDIDEFIVSNQIRVVTSSFQPSPFQHPGYKVNQYWKDLIDKYDLCVFVSSGNDGKRDKKMDNDGDYIWYVGALKTDKDGLPIRAGYSNGGEGLDFSDFTGDWSGTSFSCPYLAGKVALLLQRYPSMTRTEVYDYIKSHCMDLGDGGMDSLYGNGLFIMPKLEDESMEITKTKILVDGEVKEVKRILFNDENYIRLRDYDDVLEICTVDYDKAKNLPIVKRR